MRKDKLSSFQAKKQKLLKIKDLIEKQMKTWELMEEIENLFSFNAEQTEKINKKTIDEIWEIVKDEK